MWSRDEAVRRFMLRRRHSGNRDALRPLPEPLAQAAKSVLEASTSTLVPFTSEVLVVSELSDGAANAEAFSLDGRARVVNVSPQYYTALHLLASCIRAVGPVALHSLAGRLAKHDKLQLNVEDSLRHLEGEAKLTANEIVPDAQILRVLNYLQQARAWNDETQLPERPAPITGSHRSNTLRSVYAGVSFALGHEAAHLLLGHGSKAQGEDRSAANEILNAWLEELDVDIQGPRKYSQELRADALSTYLCAHAGDPIGRTGMLAAAGSTLALLASALVDPAWDLRESATHPSFTARARLQIEILHLAHRPIALPMRPGFPRASEGYLEGYFLQNYYICEVVANLMHLTRRAPWNVRRGAFGQAIYASCSARMEG